jgi:hypothetical protein
LLPFLLPNSAALAKTGWHGPVSEHPEVVREVGVNDFRVAAEQLRVHLDHRLLGISLYLRIKSRI